MIKLLKLIEKTAWYGIIPVLVLGYGGAAIPEDMALSDWLYYPSQTALLVSVAMFAVIGVSALAWLVREVRKPPLENPPNRAP